MTMNEDIKHDVRLVRHHLRRNLINQKDVDSHLESLPDDAEHAEETETRFVGHFEARREQTGEE